MKTTIKNLGIFLLTLLSTLQLTAQDIQRSHFPPREAGWYTFGINGGWAYQQGDVQTTLDGFGVGATLAKNLHYRPGDIFSFDLRGRLLYSQSYGLDLNRSEGILNNDALNGKRDFGEGLDYTTAGGNLGYVFSNHRTDQMEAGLEGVLTFNRLRERTGWIASLYGGINLDWYKTRIDQAKQNGDLYDYSVIDDMNDSNSSIKSTLRNNILDGIYETNADGFGQGIGKMKLMPSLGVELGYQFTPRFSMHVGHKATFAGNDILDGQQWDNNNFATGNNDIHHYTNLGLQWIIDPAKPKQYPPEITIIQPTQTPYTSRIPNNIILATIKHINSAADVDFTLNGNDWDFDFAKKDFRSYVQLLPGRNEVIITAKNAVGMDQKRLILIYKEDVLPPPPPTTRYAPEVDITNPRGNSYTSDYQDFTIKATIKNVGSKSNIDFYINGKLSNDFAYNSRSDVFSSSIKLQEGRNEIEIIGRNEEGSDRDNTTIFFEEKIKEPVVRITTPSRNPHSTDKNRALVRADIENVANKQDVKIWVNGYEKQFFDFNPTTGSFETTVNLDFGENEIVIRGRNQAGEDKDDVTIIYKTIQQPIIEPPVVTITSVSQAAANPFDPNPELCKTTILATILNIDSKNAITFRLNGRRHTNFSFDKITKVFKATVGLQNGQNDILVDAQNTAGRDQDQENTNCDGSTNIEPPQVTITQPGSYSTSTEQRNANIKATILNVQDEGDITFLVNGQEVGGSKTGRFDYNSSTGILTKKVTLREGSNTIKIIAQNEAGKDEDAVKITFNKPVVVKNPPEVTINEPVHNSTTQNQVVSLKATAKYVTSKQNIRIRLNGSTVSNFTFSQFSGNLSTKLTLKKGSNTISVWAKNNDGEDEASVRVIYNAPSNPPQVVINKPLDNSSTAKEVIDLHAVVTNITNKQNIRVKLNGNTVSNFSFSQASGAVTAKLNLKKGSNIISVWGKNDDGTDEAVVRVKYNAPKTPPVVDITQPSSDIATQKSTATIKAKVLNINGKGDIRMTVNGSSFSNFSFNTSTKLLSANLTLKKGKNTITVKATNADGSDQESVNITFNAPAPPTVTISSPKNNAVVSTTTTDVKALIKNVTSKNQVTFKVNGTTSSNFTFSRGSFSAKIKLKEGRNTISIKAQNSDGQDEKTVSVTYRPALEKPTVRFTTPARPGTNARFKRFTVKAVVKNVKSKNDITLTLNGKPTQQFNFEPQRNQVTAIVNLDPGTTAIKIVAKNSAGSANAETSINLKQTAGAKPTISIESASVPTTNPMNPNVLMSTVIATIKNVSNKNQITFTVNGKKITNFTFNSRTGNFRANFQLNASGTNTFTIKAKNDAGEATKTHTY